MKKTIILYAEESHDPLDVNLIRFLGVENNMIVVSKETKIQRLKEKIKTIPFLTHTLSPISSKFSPIKRIRINLRNLQKIKEIYSNKNADVIIFSSLYNNMFIFLMALLFPKKFKSALFVHNIHAWCGKKSGYNNIQKYTRMKLIKKFTSLFVLDDYLIEIAEKELKKMAFYFPFKTSNKTIIEQRKLKTTNSQTTILTIPGMVMPERKDYYWVFDYLEEVKEDFQLILLGKVHDKKIVKVGQQKLGKKLVYFEKYLDTNTFNDLLLQSHAIIGNINKQSFYGVYKISGVEYDGPANAIPVILEDKVFEKNTHGYFLRFSNKNEFIQIIQEIIESVKKGCYTQNYLEESIKQSGFFSEDDWQRNINQDVDVICKDKNKQK